MVQLAVSLVSTLISVSLVLATLILLVRAFISGAAPFFFFSFSVPGPGVEGGPAKLPEDVRASPGSAVWLFAGAPAWWK